MASSSVSLQQITNNFQAAQIAAEQGPVFILEDGTPRSVLVDIAEYKRLTDDQVRESSPSMEQSLAQRLGTIPFPGEWVDFEYLTSRIELTPADLV